MVGLIALAEARARLLALARPTAVEDVPLSAAAGRTLARAIVATRDQPPAPMSAMDGYAIARADWPGPWRVVGEAAAGGAAVRALGAKEAARIFTGARLPEGADMVLIQEQAARDGDELSATIPDPAPRGDNVRAMGRDFRVEEAAGTPGTPIAPAFVGLAAAMGYAELAVHRRPRIAILSTGDELVPPGPPPGPGQIVESCAPMLAAMLAGIADTVPLGIARDTPGALAEAIARARGCDALVTIGGASVGDHDLVRPALTSAGAEIDFWKVAIRPGKPLMAGRLGAMAVLGLPGNPASAFVTAHLFLLPLARALAGWTRPVPEPMRARLGTALPANAARRDHLRATLELRDGEFLATPMGDQDSSLLSVLARADALIVREMDAPPAAAGDITEVLDTRFGAI